MKNNCLVMLVLSIAASLLLYHHQAEAAGHSAGHRKLKILVSNPAFGYSHMEFQGRLADLLTDAGHEVHLLIQDSNPQLVNHTAVTRGQRVRRVPRPAGKMDNFDRMAVLTNMFSPERKPRSVWDGLWDNSMEDLIQLAVDTCGEMASDEALMGELEREHYDVLIGEAFFPCNFGIFHRIGAKTVLATSSSGLLPWSKSPFGVPTIPSWTASFISPSTRHAQGELDFNERTANFYSALLEHYVISPGIYGAHQVVLTKAFGSGFPPLEEIMSNVSLIFVNTNEFFDLQQISSNKVVQVGGVAAVSKAGQEKIGEPLQAILNKSKGAVLFSFGSVAEPASMPREIKAAFLRAFSRFPDHDFIWRCPLCDAGEEKELFASAPNVHLVEWMPQKALLKHPKLKAFITHCGIASMTEAATAGVPLVGIPLFGDQFYNTALVVGKKIGVHVDIAEVARDERVVVDALREVLDNEIYSQNGKLIGQKMAHAPFDPATKFVKWVEFAADYPHLNELNLPYREMGVFAYYSLDVILVSVAVLLLLLVAVLLVAVFVVKAIRAVMGQGWVGSERKYKTS